MGCLKGDSGHLRLAEKSLQESIYPSQSREPPRLPHARKGPSWLSLLTFTGFKKPMRQIFTFTWPFKLMYSLEPHKSDAKRATSDNVTIVTQIPDFESETRMFTLVMSSARIVSARLVPF